jgi:hypothetical protein
MTNQQITVNLMVELIVGYMLPGNPLGNMVSLASIFLSGLLPKPHQLMYHLHYVVIQMLFHSSLCSIPLVPSRYETWSLYEASTALDFR